MHGLATSTLQRLGIRRATATRFDANVLISLLLLVLLGVPTLYSFALMLDTVANAAAWRALWADPQTLPAAGLTMCSGVASCLLATFLCALLLQQHVANPHWHRLLRFLSPMLALPHAAFAIGLAFLLAPSGLLLRSVSPWATGLHAPPPWPTTQDPWGLGLIAVLVAKELPFLVWAAASQLQRADVAQRTRQELQVARSLGYTPAAAFWRVLWPQLWPRLRWPLLAVLAYSMGVVDMALVIGPTAPPTLAVLAWQWLLSPDTQLNAQGAAAAGLLTLLVAGTALVAHGISTQSLWRRRWTAGPGLGWQGRQPRRAGYLDPILGRVRALLKYLSVFGLLAFIYLAVMLCILISSIASYWPFPTLWPDHLQWNAWRTVSQSTATLSTTLSLGVCSAAVSLLVSVTWLECAPRRWDTMLRPLIYLPLVLPPVVWVTGVQGLALRWQLDGQWVGVCLAHCLVTLPYALIALCPAYLAFDPRAQALCATLGHGRWGFLIRVKWPLLKGALSYTFAVAFAVSVAQYLPTLFIGAGRLASVTTEAVTLASGAQRDLSAAFAWAQWLLPAVVFGLATLVGHPRRYSKNSSKGFVHEG